MSETALSYEQLLAENNTLREENRLLRQRLGMDELAPSIEPEEMTVISSDTFQNAAVTQSSSTDEKIDLFQIIIIPNKINFNRFIFALPQNR